MEVEVALHRPDVRRGFQVIRSVAFGLLCAGAARADGPAPAPKPPPVVQSFIATGPATEADFARLRSTLEKVPGVVSVQVRKGVGGATLTVQGDALYTLLAAAAKPVGYQMQQTPVRFYAARGPGEKADLARLRQALVGVPGVNKVAFGQEAAGLAVRIAGIAPTPALAAAAKEAGFSLRQLEAYVAAGPSAAPILEKLRKALSQVPGVEQVEMEGLQGGATLLVYGDVKDTSLRTVAKAQGYTLAALRNAAGRRAEFAVNTLPGATADEKKLREFGAGIEGIEAVEVRSDEEGQVLVLTGDRIKPDRIVAAGAAAGFNLQVVENVSLPTLTPQAGRNTPAAYEDAILEDPIQVGKPAPPFSLLSRDGVQKLSLSQGAGKRPTVLIFGSCT